ncbi:hypothetical protein [Streptomyces sp. SID12488]|uniref:DUF6907 domain-containing protein n=1 Tax=Streptomyces sp. SID12488 TaxID=2706040 RepID=UPI0013DB6424|nr:hypothetical protein [Streptomyces sp. SID12488]NEA67520.1 hypothetical protein [Streptomyces sp. SID12488]
MTSVIPEASTATPNPTDQRTSSSPVLSRTFTVTAKDTREELSFVCMPGCIIDHQRIDCGSPTTPAEVCCWTETNGDVSLPIDEAGFDKRVLCARIEVVPFAASMPGRLPHAQVEIVEDHYIEDLDPDALGVVITVLSERLTALRRTHADLVRVRAEYIERVRIEADVDQILAAITTPAAGVQA